MTQDRADSARRGDRRIAFLVAIVAFAIYIANLRVISEGDSLPARYLPFAIWGSGSVTLDSVADAARRHPKNPPYWVWRSPEGRLLSIYPIATPVLLAPFYAPVIPVLNARGWTVAELEWWGTWMEKLCAAATTASSAALLYLLVRRNLSMPRALILTAGYALGTGTWVISSQALWQHGTAELLLTLGLLAATREPEPSPMSVGWISGLLIANRPPDVFLAAALLAYVVGRLRVRALPAFLAASLPLIPVALYNLRFFHSVWGGYGVVGLGRLTHPFYGHSFLPGVAGLLASPAKGLFVFSPFLLLIAGLSIRRLRSDERALALCLLVGAVLQLILYARSDWRAGGCYGNRFLLDMLPALIWLLAIAMRPLGNGSWAALAGLVAMSIGIEAIGAFCYPGGRSDDLYYPQPLSRRVIAPAVWSWRDAPFLVEARAGIARPTLSIRPENSSKD